MRKSIRSRLVFFIIIPILIIFILVSFYNLLQLRNTTVKYTEACLQEKSYKSANKLVQKLEEIETLGHNMLAEFNSKKNPSEQEIYDLLQNSIANNPFVHGAVVAFDEYQYNSEKRLYAPYIYKKDSNFIYEEMGTTYNYTDQKYKWFNDAKINKIPNWSEPYFAKVAGFMMSSYTIPVMKNEKLWAVITIDILLDEMLRFMDVEDLESIQYYITTKSGYFIYNPNQFDTGKIADDIDYSDRNDKHFFEYFKIIQENANNTQHLFFNDYSKKNYWIHHATTGTNDWTIYMIVSKYHAMYNLRHEILLSGIFMVLIVIILLIIIIFITRRIAHPLMVLTKITEKISSGASNVDFDIKSMYEIERLATSFKKMTNKLLEREALIKKTNQRLDLAIKSSKSGIWDADINKGVDFFSMEYYKWIRRL